MRRRSRELEARLAQVRALMETAVTPLPAGEREGRVKRAREDKFFFFQTYLPHYFTVEPAPMHREIVAMLETRGRPVAIAAPRGHAKSTIVSLAYPLHQILFEQRHFIILVSDSKDQAEMFVAQVKLELEENERIRQDFGDMRTLSPWADDKFLTKNGVLVMARGSGQKIRGLRNRQYRPDLVVIDDLENDESVRNPRRIQKALKWIVEAVYGSLTHDASLFMIGTLLSRNSVLAQLLENPEWSTRKYQALLPDGTPLWPARWSKEELQHRKAIMGAASFNKEFMNDPRDEEGLFREDWIRFYDESELAGRGLAHYMFIDPSVGAGETADFKAVVTVGVDTKEMVYYVRDAWIRKASIDAMIRAAYVRYERYRPIFVGIESNGFQKVLLRDFDRYAQEKGFYLPIRQVNHSIAKESRVARLSPLVERGLLRFLRGQGDQDVLIEQLIYFPTPSVNDDGPDALEGAVGLAETAGMGKAEYYSIEKRTGRGLW